MCTVGGNVEWSSCYGKQYGGSLKKKKKKGRITTSGYIPKRIESSVSKKYLYTHVHSRIIQIAKIWKQFKCPSMDEWVSKIKHTNYNYYSFLKKKEILQYAGT